MDSRVEWQTEAPKPPPVVIGVPPKLWLLLTSALERKCAAGTAWVKAGRPRDCAMYTVFCIAERELEEYQDRADRYPRSKEQREEWTAIHRRFDP